MQIGSVPASLLDVDYEAERKIIAIGKVIRGFQSTKECVARLRAAKYTHAEIVGADAATAIWREVRRQKLTGIRPGIITKHEPKPIPVRNNDWSAVCEGYEPGDPIGYGKAELEAILDLVEQMDDLHDKRAAG